MTYTPRSEAGAHKTSEAQRLVEAIRSIDRNAQLEDIRHDVDALSELLAYLTEVI